MTSNLKEILGLRTRLEAKYKGSAELFPDFATIKQMEVIPTSSSIINAVTGVGGFPRGRVSEVSGAFSSGKTTIAKETVATMQRADPESVALFVDFEHAFDPAYAHKLGVDLSPDRLIFAQPEYFEQGAEIVDSYVSAGLVDLVFVDSAAAMTPRAEMEGKTDDGKRIGLQSALMSDFLSRITKKINKGRKPALVMLNQTRANIDIKNPRLSGGEKPAGGNALKFYTSLRLQLSIVMGEGEEERNSKAVTDQLYTQNRVRVVAIKNKVAPPFARGQFVIEYGKGVNNIASIAELAETKLGVLSGAGFINYKGDTPETTIYGRIGREGFLQEVMKNKALAEELERKVVLAILSEQAGTLGLTSIQRSGVAKDIEEEDITIGDGMPTEAR